MHQVHHELIEKVARIITAFGEGGTYLVAFFALFLIAKFVLKKQRLSIVSLFLFFSVLIPGLICDVLKMGLGRARPGQYFDHELFGFYFAQFKSSMWSFPSGHCTTITGLMIGLSLLYPRFWPFFFAVIFTVSFSRIVVDAHYLSDVMMGMYLGAIVVIWLYGQFQKRTYLTQTFA